MNKDIQTLIEREAKDANTEIINHAPIYIDADMKGWGYDNFIKGASFALSLFKWRKVEEGLPDDNARVLVKSKRGVVYLSCYSKLDGFSSNANIIEWMPIPDND